MDTRTDTSPCTVHACFVDTRSLVSYPSAAVAVVGEPDRLVAYVVYMHSY